MNHTCRISFLLFVFCSAQYILQAQNYGLQAPQTPATLPKSWVPVSPVVQKKKQVPQPVLKLKQNGAYNLEGGWEMIAAQEIREDGKTLSGDSYNSETWYNATVPGTVLTTLVDQGVYPDPAYGVNNLAIPDTLCRQQWWYRTRFTVPNNQLGKTALLQFNGINYGANIWLNGKQIGTIKGAFMRGSFDVSAQLVSGNNTIAVLISPPPHPGIPHEQSPSAGRGPNGGALCADGPTFISSEGWDWMPGIRDRNIGIWQEVTLQFSGPVMVEDPQVITQLPLPDTSSADIAITATIHNRSSTSQQVIVRAAIEGISVQQPVTLQPGEARKIGFDAATFPQLHLLHPRLWWPNGYGHPELYTLILSAIANSDTAISTVRFGVRELSYELSVDAPQHPALRVEYRPIVLSKQTMEPPFNNLQRRKVVGETFIPSLSKEIELSSFTPLLDTLTAPYLVIRVNGQRIFCKGGNWGMDDYMKRCSREHLEPYFRLHRDAHFNMVRNWTGESTEEVFFDLCDEYGLLVWNDFWMSTEGYNIPPEDNRLFMDNAREVVQRFRNHPSIALWCPRNEGYAPPELENSLAHLIAKEDGTRLYQPQSRYLNLRTSGPWHYQWQPANYFTDIAAGFSTELGTPAVPTSASMRKMMNVKDLWPISDVWYYHDLHFGLVEYRRAIDSLYGKAMCLEDFCGKAQLVNYDSYRSMFESWNSRIFNNTTGILLWMTHPAWPSVEWQIYSWDYETFGAYFASLKACEPVHVQMNLPDNKVMAVNTSLQSFTGIKARLTLYDVAGKKLWQQQATKDLLSNGQATFFDPMFPKSLPEVYLARVTLTNTKDSLLSQNDYLKHNTVATDLQGLKNVGLPKLAVDKWTNEGGQIHFTITNTAAATAIGIKLNLADKETGKPLLPTYFSDGYFNLLPGESRMITVEYDEKVAKRIALSAEAYNLPAQSIYP